MVHGIDLFFALFNNLAIFIALVAIYSYLLVRFKQTAHWCVRQTILGLSFGAFAVGCMFAKIPVYEGVIVDQRNAVVALSGAFGGPLSAFVSAALAGSFRIYLGGGGAFAGVVGVCLAATAGAGMHLFSGCFQSLGKAAAGSFLASVIILPGFLFVGDLPTGWQLTKAMALPFGTAIFLGIFLGGLLLHRAEERYRVESLFHESEKKYRELIEGTSDLITYTDNDGKITFANRVAEKIFGFSPEECVGMSAFQFIHPDDRARTREWFDKCVAQKKQQANIENRQVNAATGRSHTLLWSSSFRYDDSGNLAGVGGIARDMTEVREAEKNFKNLFEKMPDGCAIHEIVRDDDGKPVDYRLIGINPALERISGLGQEALAGMTLREAYPEAPDHLLAMYGKTATSGESTTFEHYVEELDKHFDITVYSPAENQVAAILQDITPRKKAEEEKKAFEEQIRHGQKMEAIGTLSGGIAHDLNNILVPILGYVEMGMMALSPDDKLYTNLERVQEAAERAAKLTGQILAFSRKQVLAMEVFDLNAVVSDFQKMIRHLIKEDIEMKTFLDPEIALVMADRGQIEQVLMNLIVNACDEMPNGGKLIVETANVHLDKTYIEKYAEKLTPGPHLLLSVGDTGRGMDAETRQKIFDPFFTTKEQGKGTGLGLSTVFGIVTQHGGSIHVYSEPGKGSVFRIYLPRAQGEIQASETEKEVPSSTFGTESILVVEDEEMVRQLVCECLAASGYEVLSARDPKEGLRLASKRRKPLHLLLTDVIMPVMNGRKLYGELSAIHPETKVLYMSGYTDNVIAAHGLLEEDVEFLQKPFTVKGLAQKVWQVVERGNAKAPNAN